MTLSGLLSWISAVVTSGFGGRTLGERHPAAHVPERPVEVGQGRLLVQRPAVLGGLDLDVAALGDGEGGVLGLPVEVAGDPVDGRPGRLLVVAGLEVDLGPAEVGADGVGEAGEGPAGPPEGVGLLDGRRRVDLHAEVICVHGDGVRALAEGDLLEGLGGVLLDGGPRLFLGHPAHFDVADADAALDAAVPGEKVHEREPGEEEAGDGGHHGDPSPQGVLRFPAALLAAARPAAARRLAASIQRLATRLPGGPRPACLAYFLQPSAPPTVRPATPFRPAAATRRR